MAYNSFDKISQEMEIPGHQSNESDDFDENKPETTRAEPTSSPVRDMLESVFCRRPGLWLIIASAFTLATSKMFTKLATNTILPAEIVFVRFLIQTVVLLPGALYHRSSCRDILSGGVSTFVAATMCRAFAQGACFYAISMILVADASVLMNTQPIFVCIIAWLWLGEPIGFYEICIIVATLIGVVLVCHPSFVFSDQDPDLGSLSAHIWGSLITIMAALFNAIGNCLTRKLQHVNYIIMVFSQGFVALPICLMILFATSTFQVPSDSTEYVYLIMLSLLAVLGRSLETRSFQLDQATPLTILKTLEIPGVIFLQYTFLKTSPSRLSIAGTALITTSIVLISLKEKVTMVFKKICRCCAADSENEPIIDHDESIEGEPLKKRKSGYGVDQ